MLSSRSARTTLASASLACLALLIGCADTEGRFKEFEELDAKIRESKGGQGGSGGGGGGDCALPEADAVNGDYLFALSASLNPKTPVLFRTTVTTEVKGDGLSTSLTLQPLKADDRRTPTGAPLEVGPYDIGADGSFSAQLPTLIVPGDANPISGSELEATIALSGSICAPADFVCGDITGNLARPLPLDLAGSTFTMQRVTEPNAYPEPVINCAKDPAQPLQ